MTAKDCGHHHEEKRKLQCRLVAGVLAFIALVLFVILLVYLILRPTKPRFVLQDVTVYAFNVSMPNLLSSNMQVTVSTRNPNDKVGVYYDRLDIYAVYRNQQITLPTALPPAYLGHKDVIVWSPFLYGNAVPVAPFLADALNQDQMAGTVLVNIKVSGKVKWKVGTWVSGRYRLNVNCPAYLTFGNKKFNGVVVGTAMKYMLVQSCTVDV